MVRKVSKTGMWLGLFALVLFAQTAWAGPIARAAANEPRRSLAMLGGFLVLALLVLIGKAATVAFALCASSLWPDLFRASRGMLATSPVKSFFIGLVDIALALLVAYALIALKVTVLLGLLVLVVLAAALLASRALVYQVLGAKLSGELADPDADPTTRAQLFGGIAVELAFLTPLVGPLAGVIVTLATFGALVRGILRPRATAAKPE